MLFFDHRHRSGIKACDVKTTSTGHVWMGWGSDDGTAGVVLIRRRDNLAGGVRFAPGAMQYLRHPLEVGALGFLQDRESGRALLVTGW